MPDQSKKPNQPKKAGTGNKGEASQPVNGEPSGSGGNPSTQNPPARTYTSTTSGGGGNAQATPYQSFMLQRALNEPAREGHFNHVSYVAERPPEGQKEGQKEQAELEISDDEDEEENQPGGKGKDVKR
ncbi:uncharacterized protein BKA55DRAFT_570475 [Fusarium redolens]|jgi:hypothetical protein|uniref:Uncharacterized protein n=1 Tax=Fusarium redolens TaxID=48865 RepID=A0A9P9H0N1_FUSRE|nr:uncharacterized protein BKA55DRAFT_570475 [Fusarium redolens]KAH7248973.1 hypothetical protein BKA55DRAFT_570475 [Fusarium redolens]